MTSAAGKIVTFYSYKGGTGRSMALANVAWVLASCGARVLVVDWDLEAPGLHRYFRPFLADKDLVRHESEGLIDFMIDFAGRMATSGAEDMRSDPKWIERYADISKWSKQLLWPSGQDAETGLGGSIHFVPAGRQGAAYARQVNSFDWSGFYQKYNGGAFIDAVRRSMAAFDWVLIDSRTGVSDTSGICTMQLPDTLVVCFTLNYQSIDGAAAVAQSARDGRKDSLRVLPLPTRLDGSEDKLLRAMLAYARAQFQPLMPPDIEPAAYWRAMGIPYFPRYAYSEKLAPFEEQLSDTTSTLPAVERLTSYITGGRISKLQPLPEPHREEALREFEQMPGTEQDASPISAVPTQVERLPVTLRRLEYWASQHRWQLTAVAFVALMALQWLNTPSGNAVQSSSAPFVLDAALADLQAGRRSAAALLIAEAARRLDPATVIGPVTDNKEIQLDDALRALSPLVVRSDAKKDVRLSPDGQWLAVSSPKSEVELYRFPPQRPLASIVAGYSIAAFSPDSRYMAAGGRNGSLVVFETATGRRIWQWENTDPDSAWVTAIRFAEDGSRLAAGTDTGAVVLVQVDPWKQLRQFVQKGSVDLLAFSPDSAYVATASRSDDRVTWWSQLSGKPVEIFARHDGGVADMVFLPPGRSERARRMVTAAANGALRLWTQTDNLPKQMLLSGAASRLTVSPNGTRLATSGGKSVSVWQTEGEIPANPEFTVSDTVADSARFFLFGPSPDALFYARGPTRTSSAPDQNVTQIVRWRLGSNAAVEFARLSAPATSLALSPDSRYLVFASPAGVHVLVLATTATGAPVTFSAGEVRALACSQTEQPQLSAAEWKKYFGDEPLRYTCEEATTPTPSAIPR